MTHAFVVAFRDRGTDPRRKANLDYVLAYLQQVDRGPIYLVDDGRSGTEQFNRSAAYNRGAEQAFNDGAGIITFYEADMILPAAQLDAAIAAALDHPHLVVPFTERHELNDHDSQRIRNGEPYTQFKAQVVKHKPRRTGAINTISRQAYELVGGYDETFEGSWWDDRSMHLAFDICCGPTEWIEGPSWHLHHLPGYQGRHLTAADRAATAANKTRFRRYQAARTPEQIRALTSGT